ncbi:hypothetical protein SCUCBS95973_001529 [Sporothrix curviconia]|uniref:Uncharacterized protein n=1 Tax=Sporothrix curviconia TaxID=1260050 RepID=A0ABP0AZY3_9PEZI
MPELRRNPPRACRRSPCKSETAAWPAVVSASASGASTVAAWVSAGASVASATMQYQNQADQAQIMNTNVKAAHDEASWAQRFVHMANKTAAIVEESPDLRFSPASAKTLVSFIKIVADKAQLDAEAAADAAGKEGNLPFLAKKANDAVRDTRDGVERLNAAMVLSDSLGVAEQGSR